ncbi:YdeI/OmpD-associated family protein [Glycomyces paridis]|uniref:OmdA domain containing protein n=1 Tax=Glycomyces paridis TaxID=2126555 RepID=A0A4S8P8I7_9ACTN|nr:YdeI/OmpD-associated family protein [Glycomyces paridis]THV26528.1 OmdA domain containing protein [Glycomyces paridis]
MEFIDLPDAEAWASWLERGEAAEAWLRIGKARSLAGRLRIGPALETALCFGWIDGQRKALDEDSFLQRFTPRRKGSAWSLRNRETVERLAAEGRMRPAGLAEVEAARADGRWDAAYAGQRDAETPAELAAALAAYPAAAAAFAALGRSERYTLALPVLKARTAEARERAAARLAGRLAKG